VRFLITAGPTREPLDPVRYLSNRSSGKMGYAIAAAALAEGHEVTLISGPVALSAPSGAQRVHVTTGDEMFAATSAHFPLCDVFVMCAAVCDYRPAQYVSQKMKKRPRFSLELEPTRDILASLTSQPHDCFVVGFAAETEALVANDVSRADLGMDADENELLIFSKNDAPKKLSRQKKTELARALLKIILEVREKCLTKKS